MTKMTKTLLVLSLIGLVAGLVFVTGLVNVTNAIGLYVTLPFGAILFGLFLISRMLEKETSRFDEEQRTILARTTSAPPAKSSVSATS